MAPKKRTRDEDIAVDALETLLENSKNPPAKLMIWPIDYWVGCQPLLEHFVNWIVSHYHIDGGSLKRMLQTGLQGRLVPGPLMPPMRVVLTFKTYAGMHPHEDFFNLIRGFDSWYHAIWEMHGALTLMKQHANPPENVDTTETHKVVKKGKVYNNEGCKTSGEKLKAF